MQFSQDDADLVLGLSDQYLGDWESDTPKDVDYLERQVAYDRIRPYMSSAAAMFELLVAIQDSVSDGKISLDIDIRSRVQSLLAALTQGTSLSVQGADLVATPSLPAANEPGTHVCMRCELQSRTLRQAKEALANVPLVGTPYDQQHSDTHLRASIAIEDALDQTGPVATGARQPDSMNQA